MALSSLLTPVGLVVGAIAGLGAAWLACTDAGRDAAKGFADAWTAMVDDSKTAIGAIGKAIAGGDLKAAAAVAWSFIVLEWTRGTGALRDLWTQFSSWFNGMFAAVFYGAQDVFNNVCAAIEVAWTESTAFLGSVWNKATTGILNCLDERDDGDPQRLDDRLGGARQGDPLALLEGRRPLRLQGRGRRSSKRR
jgi:hypothetical protein